MALLERLSRTGAIGPDERERQTKSLIDLEITEHRYEGRVTEWLKERLLPSLPSADSDEDRFLAALAERTGSSESFVWEGDTHTVDDAAATALAVPRPWPDVPEAPESKKIVERVIKNLGRIARVKSPR